ncbi:MAG TPA: 2-phosphosulfolactate phosphatase [Gemmatimonadaceae bacterium]|nr:2-phosphosulfolactate phosphatase [Gemmatimonadaceae bacterium]
MRVDVFFGYQQLTPADITGRVVAVVDVLRASTTIAAALANGARAIVPFLTSDEAVAQSKQLGREDVLLAGEQKMLPIPGFDLGNSPGEFTAERVQGKTVLLTTTNGSGAVLAAQGARDIVVASYVNFSAVAAMLRAAIRSETDVVILCSGHERRFTLEDAGCAGRYVRAIQKGLNEVATNDGATACALIDRKYGENIAKLLQDSNHGQALLAAGFGDDVAFCAAVDSFSVVPVYSDRQIVPLGAGGG